MPRTEYDLAVIGAGAGGLIASRFAAQLGARVALVEKDRIGGDCTWTGCVPSKALIRAAKAAHEMRAASRFGIDAGAPAVDMTRVHAYVQQKVRQVYEPTAPDELTREGIDVHLGPAAFVDPHTLSVGERSIRARRYLVCTGAAPVAPPIDGLDRTPHFTYHTIFENSRLPQSLVVVGGGPLGVEMAQAYQRLGSQVTIVAPRVLPRDDPDAADLLRQVFEREGIRIIQGRVGAVRQGGAGIIVADDNGHEVPGDCLLVAAGRRPNVEGLGLDRAGVAYSARGIHVDDRLRTSVPHIYAAGDVVGGEQFSHVAGWQAFEAARNALLPGSASGRTNPIAWVTFTDPEVAQVGPTEATLRERLGNGLVVTRWGLTQIDRARCDDDEVGFIKLLSDPKGVIVGATAVAARAGELSGELSLAVARRLTLGEMSSAIHAYPTYATALQQMASQAAMAQWIGSTQGRLVRRVMGFSAPAGRT